MLRKKYNKKFNNTSWRSGQIYQFNYKAWENDPRPIIVFMYAFEGTHPTTGRQWRFFQGINFTYVPRSVRKEFAEVWISEIGRGRDPRLTYQKAKRRWPGLIHATRRYFYSPSDYIKKSREIPYDQWEDAIVSTFARDFSKKVKSSLINKFRMVLGRRKARKKQKKFNPKSLRKI